MHLLPREIDKLVISQVGTLAQKRLARGLRLNVAEATGLICAVLHELIRDGNHSVAELMSIGASLSSLLIGTSGGIPWPGAFDEIRSRTGEAGGAAICSAAWDRRARGRAHPSSSPGGSTVERDRACSAHGPPPRSTTSTSLQRSRRRRLTLLLLPPPAGKKILGRVHVQPVRPIADPLNARAQLTLRFRSQHVPALLHELQVEGAFPDGVFLVTVHDPICSASVDDNLTLALYGSFLPLPADGVFPKGSDEPVGLSDEELPGALVLRKEMIRINEGRERVKLKVTNTGDRPIQVRSPFALSVR